MKTVTFVHIILRPLFFTVAFLCLFSNILVAVFTLSRPMPFYSRSKPIFRHYNPSRYYPGACITLTYFQCILLQESGRGTQRYERKSLFLHSVISLTECIGIVRVGKYRVVCLSVCVCVCLCFCLCVCLR